MSRFIKKLVTLIVLLFLSNANPLVVFAAKPVFAIIQVNGLSTSTNKNVKINHTLKQASIGIERDDGKRISLGEEDFLVGDTSIKINYSNFQGDFSYRSKNLIYSEKAAFPYGSAPGRVYLGYGEVTKGESSVTASGRYYVSTEVSGSSLFVIRSWEFWGFFEFMLGYRTESVTFKNYRSGSTEAPYPVRLDSALALMGFGITFK